MNAAAIPYESAGNGRVSATFVLSLLVHGIVLLGLGWTLEKAAPGAPQEFKATLVMAKCTSKYDPATGEMIEPDGSRRKATASELEAAGQPVEEPERRQRLEDRRPHRVEVDRAGHHGDVDLVVGELGRRHLLDTDRLGRVLGRRLDPFEHACVLAPHDGGSERLGDREIGDLVARGIGQDRIEDVLHGRTSRGAGGAGVNLARRG